MKHIFVIGESPLPDEKSEIRMATHLRTWQFVKPLREAGYEITVLTIDAEYKKNEVLEKHKEKSLRHFVLPKNEKLLIKTIKEFLEAYHFDAAISVNNYPSYVMAMARPQIPFWADLNGWLMAEGALQAEVENDDSFLSLLWHREKSVIGSADKMSVVSHAQKKAITEELVTIRRIKSEGEPYDFFEVVVNATEHFPNDEIERDVPLFRGKQVPEDAFVVAFVGGYNTWVDEKTLFKGIERAMEKNPKIHFVSTGGSISGLVEGKFANFKKLIDESAHSDRFRFLGWIRTEEVGAVYNESDCGINVDFICPETLTGARNRINEMLKFGLPVITTLGTELSHDLKKEQVAVVVPSGSAKKLSEAILHLAEDQSLRDKLKEKSLWYSNEHVTYAKTMQPLLKWLEQPTQAPYKKIPLGKASLVKAGLFYLKKRGLKATVKKIVQKIL